MSRFSAYLIIACLGVALAATAGWGWALTKRAVSPASVRSVATSSVPTATTAALAVAPSRLPIHQEMSVTSSSTNGCRQVPIIMYHYIEPVIATSSPLRQGLTTAPGVFEAQIATLQQAGYKSYFVSALGNLIRQPVSKPAMITVDDGYEDFYTEAFPILQRHHFKATLYVISNFIGRPGYLTADEIRTLLGSGLVELGSHTLDHPDLTTLPPAKQALEIIDSKHDLEQRFGVAVPTFAYPSGRFNPAVEHIAAAHYQVAVTTLPGMCQSTSTQWLARRFRASNFGSSDIARRLEGLERSSGSL